MKIIFIQTGGTIDKDYPKKSGGYAFKITEPAAMRILKRLNPSFDYEIISLCKKDSLDITDRDREKIYSEIQKLKENKIIITHGTDTMIETARRLSNIEGKVIIITGAMKPERFKDSDASINLGVAIGAVNSLENGTYIAMNGRVIHWDKVRRDPETGKFI